MARKFAAFVPIYGTLVSSLIAMMIAIPVSFGIAMFLTEIAPQWMRQPVAMAIELLAGIPSIIYGMWGLFVFVPFMSDYVEPALNDYLGPLPLIGVLFTGPPLGIGMLTAGIILGIMVIPFISSVMRDVFLLVPTPLKESAYADGLHDLGSGYATWCCPTRARQSWEALCWDLAVRWARPWRSLLCLVMPTT